VERNKPEGNLFMGKRKNILLRKWNKLSLQWKLTTAFVFTSFIMLVVNFVMYFNINQMMRKIDEVYISNINLNELSDSLNHLQNSMTDYLNTKSSAAIDAYYRSEQQYRKLLDNLNIAITDNEMLLMEKNIRNMSENYLDTAFETVQAKRGRNVEKYKDNYERAKTAYQNIKACLYSLNNEQFKYNSGSYRILLNTLRYMEVVSTSVLIVIAVINIGLIILLTRSITKPLNNLAKVANEVSSGKLNIEPVAVESEDEVGVVSGAFNKMILNIRVYIEQIRENLEKERILKEKELRMEGHLKDAKLKILQAQINPHFLFNTLNAGAQLAMMEGADQSCLFIEHMAEFFRYNMNKMDQVVTVADEVRLVDSYIYILNVRFSGDINFDREIDESILDTQIPAMVLQPIVENAVNYGIRDIDRNGVIRLSAYRGDTDICLSVKDNGIGMKKEKITQVLAGRRLDDELAYNSNGVGLVNVINRLKLYFNREDVIEIKSEGKDRGTEVVIHIPL